MNKRSKLWSVLSYITWIGWLVAFFARDRGDTLVRRHINQALVLNLLASVGSFLTRLGGLFAIIGEIVDIAILVLSIMGIVRACKLSEEPLPLIGGIELLK